MKNHTDSVYVIRKSFPLLTVRIILVELLLEGIYLLWRIGVDFLPLASETRVFLHQFTTVIFIFVTILQVFLLLVLFLRWSTDYYELQDDEVIKMSGVFSKNGKAFAYQNIQSITVRQSLLGRLLRYGTVYLYIPVLGQDIAFNEVPNPYAFIALIKKNMNKKADQGFIFRRK